ncbi:MAG: sodium:proton antiporter, partial [Oscillospiraceae bacterium]|nr:sodium:proton antiporter [Oscillospiraceae bacterium]
GIMTALWRQAGTVSVIVLGGCSLISPKVIVPMSFVLCSMVSVLIGTSFGTAATMGVICASLAGAMGISPALYGGAILAGCYFGDRCSPVSTSALLVSGLTKTNLHDNIKEMAKTAVIPFIISVILYIVFGGSGRENESIPDLYPVFAGETSLSLLCLIPAAVIIILSLLRMKVKRTMIISIASTVPVCLFVQKASFADILKTALLGYVPKTEAASQLLNGGGAASMINVVAILCISSAYAGIFSETELISGIKKVVGKISDLLGPFGAAASVSVLTSAISCNQTLATMLTHQLCSETERDEKRMAIILENTAIVIAPLIPWSIAGGVPLATVGAPSKALLFAFFLYVLPIYGFVRSFFAFKRKNKSGV